MPEFDTEHRDEAVCPHCGHVGECSYELFGDFEDYAETETVCNQCDKPFKVRLHITVTYTTEKL